MRRTLSVIFMLLIGGLAFRTIWAMAHNGSWTLQLLGWVGAIGLGIVILCGLCQANLLYSMANKFRLR